MNALARTAVGWYHCSLCYVALQVNIHMSHIRSAASRRDFISREELQRLKQLRVLPNLIKMPLFFGGMVLLTWLAWITDSNLIKWSAYVALGYLWMGIVTFMHDATHNVLFKDSWKNWVFGIIAMIPLFASFVAFKEDHMEHHRYNRSPKDPDAFTMGKRSVVDFIVFYAYIVAGAVLSFVHFNLIYRKIETNGILDAAKDLGVSIIAYSPLASGLLSGKFHKHPEILQRKQIFNRASVVLSGQDLMTALSGMRFAYGMWLQMPSRPQLQAWNGQTTESSLT